MLTRKQQELLTEYNFPFDYGHRDYQLNRTVRSMEAKGYITVTPTSYYYNGVALTEKGQQAQDLLIRFNNLEVAGRTK